MTEDCGAQEISRRTPRPTIRFLRLLPRETFPNALDAQAISAGRWEKLSIALIEHPLISDARSRFETGLPTRHKEASQVLGKPVFEVRARQGAAWRAAAILDDNGDPWLVWAARHDQFHSQVGEIFKRIDPWLPTEVEYKLRDRDEACDALDRWHKAAITRFIDAISEAVLRGETRLVLPSRTGATHFDVDIELEHDTPAEPESSDSLATMRIRIGRDADDFVRFILPVIQPDITRIDSTFTVDSKLELWVSLTQAKLVQIAAASQIDCGEVNPNPPCPPLTHLHYVGAHYLADAMINGIGARALCGLWFVPTRDEHARLPVCPECERKRPVAKFVASQIASLLAKRGQRG